MVRNIQIAVCMAALGLWGSGVWAAPAQDPPDPVLDALTARVRQFLEGVSLGATQTAYQELLAGSPLAKQAEAVKALVAKTDLLEEQYGKYREFELIASRRVGKDLVLLTYLYKCEQSPVVFYFTFYRTPRSDGPTESSNNWRVITVRFDAELELLALLPGLK